jgi:hypothetical protein
MRTDRQKKKAVNASHHRFIFSYANKYCAKVIKASMQSDGMYCQFKNKIAFCDYNIASTDILQNTIAIIFYTAPNTQRVGLVLRGFQQEL